MNDHDAPSQSRRITLSDGAEVATRTIGPNPHVPCRGDVIICHGTPWSSRMWLPTAAELARDHRVHLWDMPGYGESIPPYPRSADPSTEAPSPAEAVPTQSFPALDLPTQSHRLAELIEIWQLPAPHVIAHDIGGAVALGAHLMDGCDFASLLLLDVVTLDPWGSPFFRLVAENSSVFAALPADLHRALVREYIHGAAGPALAAAPTIAAGPTLTTGREDGSAPDWVDDLAAPWCTRTGQAAFYRQIASLSPAHTEPIVDRLGEVRCRVRIGWGADDPWIPVDQAERLALALPGRPEVTTYPGVGHLLPLEARGRLTADIVTWLESNVDTSNVGTTTRRQGERQHDDPDHSGLRP